MAAVVALAVAGVEEMALARLREEALSKGDVVVVLKVDGRRKEGSSEGRVTLGLPLLVPVPVVVEG